MAGVKSNPYHTRNREPGNELVKQISELKEEVARLQSHFDLLVADRDMWMNIATELHKWLVPDTSDSDVFLAGINAQNDFDEADDFDEVDETDDFDE